MKFNQVIDTTAGTMAMSDFNLAVRYRCKFLVL